MLVTGNFITTFVNGEETSHSSGILAYNPSTNEFYANFSGGAYVNSPYSTIGLGIWTLKSTPR